MRNFRALAMALTLSLFPAGCGVQPAVPQQQPVVDTLVWPAPPAQPRIRYTGGVSTPADWGIKRSFFGRMFDALTGQSTENFVRPTSVAERNGILYIADPGAQVLWVLDRAKNRYSKVTHVGKTQLVSPVAVALGPEDSVYLADTWLKQVFLLDRDGNLVRIAAQDNLERPAGIAFDSSSQRLYVADSVLDRISIYGRDGSLVRTLGKAGTGNGEFNSPTHVAVDQKGTLLVTDALNFRVQAFDRDDRFLWKMGSVGDGSGDFAAPKGLACDNEGRVYVVDALFDAVQIFDREGNLLLAFGEHGTRAGQFWLPGGIFIDSQDRIYVADSYNRRIQIFRGGIDRGKEEQK